VAGAGPGTFEIAWLRERTDGLKVRDAHSLYAESLAEVGLVGTGLILLVLLLPLSALMRGRERTLVPVAAGAYAAFLVHAGLDWDWELAGVATVGVLLGCALLLEGRERQAEPRYRAAWAAGAAGLFLAACVTLVGAIVLDGAREALREGRPADAARAAERATSVQPWASEPWLVLAEARRSAGGDAAEAAREGLERDGNDWRLWAALAQSSQGAERERALARARSLNPLGPFDDL
jgi:hypothetical protein